ncbi:CENP-B N-terminal DNA-binding domain [Popillia japonica]|uniref:CENP-B N-terminal DNA-binding domain n=1 Tax=Popillia japonica TaxID=7064 RepID=A0AAW1MEY7_POPJA
MSSNSKRKRVVLSLADKIKIIDYLDKGVNGSLLAQKYGIGLSTLSDIRKNSSSIMMFASDMDRKAGCQSRKTMKTAKNRDLESAVYEWFVQYRGQGQRVTGPMICEKALELNSQLKLADDFRATSGWLSNFKRRHGIKNLEIYGEKQLAAESIAGQLFKEKFKDVILNEFYDLNNVYSSEEFVLYWKALPGKCGIEEEIKESQHEQITLIMCSNAAGTHKLPLLVIGKDEVCDSPVVFRNETIMLSYNDIFIDWYDNIFVPEVKKQPYNSRKVLLLIDNDSFRLDDKETTFQRDDGGFKLLQFPTSLNTSNIQPMKQGIVTHFKQIYRKSLIETLLLKNQENIDRNLLENYQNFNLKNASFILASSWDNISESILARSWQNLTENFIKSEPYEIENKDYLSETLNMIVNIPEFKNCTLNGVSDWFDWENSCFNDGFITNADYLRLNRNVVMYEVKSTAEDDDCEITVDPVKDPSHEEAFHALEVAMNWLRNQQEGEMEQLEILQDLRDLAAKKCGILVKNDDSLC